MATSSAQSYIAIRDDSARLSNNERDFILCASSANKTTRTDGRKPTQRRPVQLHLVRAADNLATCTVLLGGETRVSCTVTGELVAPPFPDRPNEGSIAFSVDISPASSTAFRQATPASTGGGIGSSSSNLLPPLADRHQKLTCNHILRCLERCLLQGGALDTEALCVVPGCYVWKLQLAVTVLDDGGNLVDGAVLACLAAVRHYRKPVVTTYGNGSSSSSSSTPVLVPAHLKEPTPLPLHHTPLTITFALFRTDSEESTSSSTTTTTTTTTRLLIDPTRREELCQTGSITIGMNAHSEICLLDFSGGCELTIADLRACHQQAAAHIQPLCQSLETALEQADQQVLEERLEQLKKRQQQQQQQQLPPLPESIVEPPPAVPFFEQTDQEEVPLDRVSDEVTAEQDAAAAAQEEEAYRRQALDYNLGHVASKVRENKAPPIQQQKAKSSSLLAAMLASVQGDQPPEQTPQITVPMEIDDKPLPPKESLQPEVPRKMSDEPKPTVATDKPKPPLPSMDSDDDEEETTVQLESEFQSIQPTAAPKNEVDVDDDVDDLAAAITKKKKKKKGKKK